MRTFKILFVVLVVGTVSLFATSSASAKNNSKKNVVKSPSTACLLSIQAAEEAFAVAANYVRGVNDYVNGLTTAAGQASAAGGTVSATVIFLQTQTTLLQTLNANTQTAASDLTGPAQRFNSYKAECRAGR